MVANKSGPNIFKLSFIASCNVRLLPRNASAPKKITAAVAHKATNMFNMESGAIKTDMAAEGMSVGVFGKSRIKNCGT